MEFYFHWGFWLAALQVLIICGVTLRVIFTRHPPGASFAWILITTIIPFAGFILYIMFGERPIGRIRAWRYRRLIESFRLKDKEAKNQELGHLPAPVKPYQSMIRLAKSCSFSPVTHGNNLTLLSSPEASFASMVDAINTAQKTIDMAFYIWAEGGMANNVRDALLQARSRNVLVRILVDDFASRKFLESETAKVFREAGIEVSNAMPMKLLRIFGLQRADLRLHRKLVVIDNRVAFTGSLNMIDPSTYEAAKRVGDWVDAMVKIEGPAVHPLENLFLTDWMLQPDHQLGCRVDPPPENLDQPGEGIVISVPSGPNTPQDPNLHLLLEAINQARESIVLTTPYFVPNEVLITSLLNALYRGASVKIIIPEREDNRMVTWASRRYFDDLLSAGAEILLYRDGLLHTKSLSVDHQFTVFGTVNFDNRSMHLNYELMLLIFDQPFIDDIYELLASYESQCDRVILAQWRQRPWRERLLEGACFLLSPLL